MAVYQVPQFLDKGDKVFFGMNFLQLLITMFGFGLSYLVFFITDYLLKFIFPGGGFNFLSLVPSLPIFLIFAYVGMGQFNGRDTYLYSVKFFANFLSNRNYIYQRKADLSDLEAKFGSLNYAQKEKELQLKYQKKLDDQKHDYLTGSVSKKTEFIKDLGRTIDTNYINTSANLVKQQQKLQKKQ
jgi:hypothetical protein